MRLGLQRALLTIKWKPFTMFTFSNFSCGLRTLGSPPFCYLITVQKNGSRCKMTVKAPLPPAAIQLTLPSPRLLPFFLRGKLLDIHPITTRIATSPTSAVE